MIYFFIDIGEEFGYGNLFRCLPIHLEFIKKKRKSTIVYNSNALIDFKIENSMRYDWHRNIQYLKIKRNDIIIVDSYYISLKNQKFFNSISKFFFIIDDYGKQRFKNEKIIDWSIKSHAFKRLSLNKKNCIIGHEYAPLREIFLLNHNKFCVRKRLKKVIIIFGGSDVNNLTKPVLESLISEFQSFEFTVISIKNEIIEKYFKNESKKNNIRFIKKPREKFFISTLLNNDLAIVSGGHLLFELACIGIPTIHIKSTNDQVVSIPWKDTGFTRYAGSAKQKNLINNIFREIEYYKSFLNRYISSRSGTQYIDGKGAKRLTDRILKKKNE